MKSPFTRFRFQPLYTVRTPGAKTQWRVWDKDWNPAQHLSDHHSPSGATAQLLSSFLSTEPLKSSCKPNSFLLDALVPTSSPETQVSLADSKVAELTLPKDVALSNFFCAFPYCCLLFLLLTKSFFVCLRKMCCVQALKESLGSTLLKVILSWHYQWEQHVVTALLEVSQLSSSARFNTHPQPQHSSVSCIQHVLDLFNSTMNCSTHPKHCKLPPALILLALQPGGAKAPTAML